MAKSSLFIVVILILVMLVACNQDTDEPTEPVQINEPTDEPKPIATEEPTALPEPSVTPEPEPTATPAPTDTPVPTETPVAKGRVKGCVYWTDGSKVEATINFAGASGVIEELETKSTGGCFDIIVPPGQYEIFSVGGADECYQTAGFCMTPYTMIDVKPGGVVEIDFHPES